MLFLRYPSKLVLSLKLKTLNPQAQNSTSYKPYCLGMKVSFCPDTRTAQQWDEERSEEEEFKP